MKKLQTVLVAMSLIVGGAFVGSTITPSASAQAERPIQLPGKYQMTVVPNSSTGILIFVLNTSTGQCFQGAGGSTEWNDMKSPFTDMNP